MRPKNRTHSEGGQRKPRRAERQKSPLIKSPLNNEHFKEIKETRNPVTKNTTTTNPWLLRMASTQGQRAKWVPPNLGPLNHFHQHSFSLITHNTTQTPHGPAPPRTGAFYHTPKAGGMTRRPADDQQAPDRIGRSKKREPTLPAFIHAQNFKSPVEETKHSVSADKLQLFREKKPAMERF